MTCAPRGHAQSACLIVLAVSCTGACHGGPAGSSTPGGTGGRDGLAKASTGGGDARSTVPVPVAMGCVADVAPGHHVFACDGVNHDVEVPASCLERQCGLVVDMHGSNMIADQENDNTNMRELGRQFGYVVLQPNAPVEVEPTLDAPVQSMMTLLVEAFHLDEKRIHMTGFSRGGYMTWRFVCDHADLLASAAPMSATTGGNPDEPPGCPFSATAKPAVEISLVHLQGTKDPFISSVGAEGQRDAVVAAWQMGPGREVAGDATYRRVRYENTNGTVFDFVEHDYSSDNPDVLGHCFPSGTSPVPTDPISAAFGCTKPNSFHWGSEVMQFFIAHPKR